MNIDITDVMLNDWVNKKYSDVGLKAEKIDLYDFTDGVRKTPYLEGLPITKEILISNGMNEFNYINCKEDGFRINVEYRPLDGTRFEIIDKSTYFFSKRLYYVHELQHALRLCGLTDFADNFKISKQ